MLTVGDQVIPPPELAGGLGRGDPRSPDREAGRQRSAAWAREGGCPELVGRTQLVRTLGDQGGGSERLWESWDVAVTALLVVACA